MDFNNKDRKKTKINLSDVVPGMIIAQTLTNPFGAIIVHDGTIVTESLIHKLQLLNITKLYIYAVSDKEIERNQPHFSKTYDKGKEMVVDFIKDVGNGKSASLDKLIKISDHLLSHMSHTQEVIDTISSLRTVDEYLYTHSLNVSLLSALLGRWLKFDDATIKLLSFSGLLHDIGKTQIPDEILNKPGKLNPEEKEIMDKHPWLGYKLIENIPSMNKNVLLGVLLHHEREDGSGYPMRFKRNKIDAFGKIIAIADIYDAMTSDRVYKTKNSPFEVLKMFEDQCFGLLDPQYLITFLSNIANYYVGDFVKLNTGDIAEIVYINPHHVSKPLVRIDNSYVDMFHMNSLEIVELIK